jgi:RNA-binding protein
MINHCFLTVPFLFLPTPRNSMQLDNATIKRLKGIGHELKPVVMIGNKGITPTITEEIDRALSDHELIKVKLPAGTKEERDVIGAELAAAAKASLVHSIGRMALLLRKNPNANPKLSNLARHTQ